MVFVQILRCSDMGAVCARLCVSEADGALSCMNMKHTSTSWKSHAVRAEREEALC